MLHLRGKVSVSGNLTTRWGELESSDISETQRLNTDKIHLKPTNRTLGVERLFHPQRLLTAAAIVLEDLKRHRLTVYDTSAEEA